MNTIMSRALASALFILGALPAAPLMPHHVAVRAAESPARLLALSVATTPTDDDGPASK